MVLRLNEKFGWALRFWKPFSTRDRPADKLDHPEITYPSFCLRGVRVAKWVITDHNQVDTAAYVPDYSTADNRADGAAETSINWEDEPESLTLLQGKRAQSEHGVARLARDAIANVPNTRGALLYERKKEDDNPYHGNILFGKDLPKPFHKMVCATLALASEYIPPPHKKK